MALPALITDFNKQTVNYGMAVGESLQKLGQQVGQTLAMQEYQKQAVESLPALQQSMSESIKLIGEGKTGEGYNMLFNTVLSDPRNLTNPILSQVVNLGLQTGKQAGNEYAEQLIARARGVPAGQSLAERIAAKALGLADAEPPPPENEGADQGVDLTKPTEEMAVVQNSVAPKPFAEAQKSAAEAMQQEVDLGNVVTGGDYSEIENIGDVFPGVVGIVAEPKVGATLNSFTLSNRNTSTSFQVDKSAVEAYKQYRERLTEQLAELQGSAKLYDHIKKIGGIKNLRTENTTDGFRYEVGKDEKTGKPIYASLIDKERKIRGAITFLKKASSQPFSLVRKEGEKAKSQITEDQVQAEVREAYNALLAKGVNLADITKEQIEQTIEIMRGAQP